MPELPEVETALRGIAPHLTGRRILRLLARERRLRWPVPETVDQAVAGQRIIALRRRAKYLLLELEEGTLLLHLGMSGSLRVLPAETAPSAHDHIDLVLTDGQCLRLRDPRRFGSLHWVPPPVEAHPLLRELGPEPLSDAFDGAYLHRRAARPTERGEGLHHGQPHRRRRRQHLRQRVPVHGRHPSAASGRAYRRAALSTDSRTASSRCSPRPSPKAAPACATSCRRTATPATSPSSYASTAATGHPAPAAASQCGNGASASAPAFTVRAANAKAISVNKHTAWLVFLPAFGVATAGT